MPHHADEAFEIVVKLQSLFARLFPSRGSGYLKRHLHRASARLTELIIISACEDDASSVPEVQVAPRMCRIVDGMLRALKDYRVMQLSDHDAALELIHRLSDLIWSRFFGSSDDGSSSPPSSNISLPITTPRPPSVGSTAASPAFG
jgi:hypothetical protein